MKTKIYLILALFIASMIGVIAYQRNVIKSERAEKEVYKTNTNTLLSEVELYRTESNKSVAKVKELSLTLSEYQKYRAEDMQTINELKVDKKRLQSINTANTETIYSLKAQAKDTIIIKNDLEAHSDTLKCVSINNAWLSFNGCIDKNNQFTGDIKTRDRITCIEHIEPKRFLFFKWGVKSRQLEVVSDNPYTTITDAEFITIRK